MTVRVLVEPPADPADGLAIALRCTMDVYLRIPRDVVLVVPDRSRTDEGPLARLVGEDAAKRVATAPQPFADHTMRAIAHDEVPEAGLEDTLVIVGEATAETIAAVERHKIAALIVLPAPETDLTPWAVRTKAELVRGTPADA